MLLPISRGRIVKTNMKSIFVLLVSVVFMVGCATNIETTLRNDAGQIRYCYLSHDSTLARVTATAEYNKCLNEAGAAGYKKIQ
jgi:hypothetical protein